MTATRETFFRYSLGLVSMSAWCGGPVFHQSIHCVRSKRASTKLLKLCCHAHSPFRSDGFGRLAR